MILSWFHHYIHLWTGATLPLQLNRLDAYYNPWECLERFSYLSPSSNPASYKYGSCSRSCTRLIDRATRAQYFHLWFQNPPSITCGFRISASNNYRSRTTPYSAVAILQGHRHGDLEGNWRYEGRAKDVATLLSRTNDMWVLVFFQPLEFATGLQRVLVARRTYVCSWWTKKYATCCKTITTLFVFCFS